MAWPMLPAPESLVVYPDAYHARRLAGTPALDVGRQLGQLVEAGKIHVFLVAWTEVSGDRRIPGGTARLYPSAWTTDHIDNPEAWFDRRVCESSGDVEQILRGAMSSGLGLTPNSLRQMCWGPIELHRHEGERAWMQAAFDASELSGVQRANASPVPLSKAAARQELVRRMRELDHPDLTDKNLGLHGIEWVESGGYGGVWWIIAGEACM